MFDYTMCRSSPIRTHARIAGDALASLQQLDVSQGVEALRDAIQVACAQKSGVYWNLRIAWRLLLQAARLWASPDLKSSIDTVMLLNAEEESVPCNITIHDLIDIHTEICFVVSQAYA